MDALAPVCTDSAVAADSTAGVSAPVFLIPEQFDAEQILPIRLRGREDDANWFVGTVLRKAAHDDVDPYGHARLHSAILRRVMSQRTYSHVIKSLVEGDVIAKPSPHYAGERSRGYKLTPEYLSDEPKLVLARDERLIERLLREHAQMQAKRVSEWLPIHCDLCEAQRALSIVQEADVILSSLESPAKLCQMALVHNLRVRSPSFSVSSTGRVFNGVTGLKRILRHSVRLAGEPIGGVDIRCTQPALLAMLLGLGNTHIAHPAHDIPRSLVSFPDSPCSLPLRCSEKVDDWAAGSPAVGSDFVSFRELVLAGELYSHLLACCLRCGVSLDFTGCSPLERVKTLVLQDVLAKRGSYPSDFENMFRAEFPSVHLAVRWFNRDNHAALIRALQRLESWLVIENVAPLLVKRIPIVTLHDAIFSRLRDLPLVEDAFKETFDRLGFDLKIKRELPRAPEL